MGLSYKNIKHVIKALFKIILNIFRCLPSYLPWYKLEYVLPLLENCGPGKINYNKIFCLKFSWMAYNEFKNAKVKCSPLNLNLRINLEDIAVKLISSESFFLC